MLLTIAYFSMECKKMGAAGDSWRAFQAELANRWYSVTSIAADALDGFPYHTRQLQRKAGEGGQQVGRKAGRSSFGCMRLDSRARLASSTWDLSSVH